MTDKLPRGIRNLNPLNVERHANTVWQGQSKKQRDKRFLTFDHPVFGIRCAAIVLLNYEKRGINTIQKIVETWAPSSENNVEAYVNSVSKITGFPPNVTIKLSSPADFGSLIEAMAKHENGIYLPWYPVERPAGKACYVTMAGIMLAYSQWQPKPRKNVYTAG